MTSEEYDKLTDEEKRIKIAELCGWREATTKDGWVYLIDPITKVLACHPYHPGCSREMWLDFAPDYLNDLNAMHEAETVLDNGVDATRYINRLVTICEDSIYHQPYRSVRATAEQRAKAFVLTLME